MRRVYAGLEKVQARVEKGQLKRPEKIGAAVERVLQRDHGYRYYDWSLLDGALQITEHPVNLPREKKYEGRFLIQTDQTNITPKDAVAHYKELNEAAVAVGEKGEQGESGKRHAGRFRDGEQIGLTDIGSECVVARCADKHMVAVDGHSFAKAVP